MNFNRFLLFLIIGMLGGILYVGTEAYYKQQAELNKLHQDITNMYTKVDDEFYLIDRALTILVLNVKQDGAEVYVVPQPEPDKPFNPFIIPDAPPTSPIVPVQPKPYDIRPDQSI